MKKRSFNKKLKLGKEFIANLNQHQMINVIGGYEDLLKTAKNCTDNCSGKCQVTYKASCEPGDVCQYSFVDTCIGCPNG